MSLSNFFLIVAAKKPDIKLNSNITAIVINEVSKSFFVIFSIRIFKRYAFMGAAMPFKTAKENFPAKSTL